MLYKASFFCNVALKKYIYFWIFMQISKKVSLVEFFSSKHYSRHLLQFSPLIRHLQKILVFDWLTSCEFFLTLPLVCDGTVSVRVIVISNSLEKNAECQAIINQLSIFWFCYLKSSIFYNLFYLFFTRGELNWNQCKIFSSFVEWTDFFLCMYEMAFTSSFYLMWLILL